MELREKLLLRGQVDFVESLSTSPVIRLETEGFRHDTKAPTSECVSRAKSLLRILSKFDFLPEKIVPSGAGGITLFYYNGGDYPVMFEVQNEGKIWAAYMNGPKTYIEQVYLDNFDPKVVKELKSRLG